jgi:hypothetical protein
MLQAVHFNDEPGRRSKEVHDEASEHDLTAKRGAQLTGPERLPQDALGLGWRLPHGVRARVEDLLTT